MYVHYGLVMRQRRGVSNFNKDAYEVIHNALRKSGLIPTADGVGGELESFSNEVIFFDAEPTEEVEVETTLTTIIEEEEPLSLPQHPPPPPRRPMMIVEPLDFTKPPPTLPTVWQRVCIDGYLAAAHARSLLR